jgi:type I restriction enzyme S subunit
VNYVPDGDLLVIKAENAGKEGFRYTDFSSVHSSSVRHLERSYLHGGELLMVFVGVGVGQVAIVPSDRPYFLGPNIGMIRVQSQFAYPKYCEWFLRSSVGYGLSMSFTKAVAQPSLSMGTIRQIPLLLPPVEEQKKIVEEIEQRVTLIAAAEQQIHSNLRRAARLRQSILKHAFEGKLVPQDPNDEPASVLLDRLRASQPSHDANGKGATPARTRGRRAKSKLGKAGAAE